MDIGSLFSNVGSAVHSALSSVQQHFAPQPQQRPVNLPPKISVPPPPGGFKTNTQGLNQNTGTSFQNMRTPMRVAPPPQTVYPFVAPKNVPNPFGSNQPAPSARMITKLPPKPTGPTYFVPQPSPNLQQNSARDLLNFGIGAARSIPRAAMTAVSTATGQPYQAVDPASKFIFGNEPIPTGQQVYANVSKFLNPENKPTSTPGKITLGALAAGSIVSELFPALGGADKKAIEEVTNVARNSKNTEEFLNGMRSVSDAGHTAYSKVLTDPNNKINTATDFYKAVNGQARVAEKPVQSATILSRNTLRRSNTATKTEELAKPSSSLPSKVESRLLPKGENSSASSIPRDVKISSESKQYLQELEKAQEAARSTGVKATLSSRPAKVASLLKREFIDSTAPFSDAITKAEKDIGRKVAPENDVRMQTDRVLRSSSIASQFARDNGLTDVIKNVPDTKLLDQYMIAKHAPDLAAQGIETGRNAQKDAKLVKELAPVYEPYAKATNQYSQKLLDYATKAGLINKDVAQGLKAKYPNYVPVNRIFNELEASGVYKGASKQIASLGKQTFLQKIKGSQRSIESPLQSLLDRTTTAFSQGERNIAGKMLANSQVMPKMAEVIKELKPGESAAHTFSYLDNGVKRTFETTPEIAAAAKSLNKEQMNVILRVLSYPTRVLRLGATGLNIPFVARNIIKDQVTMFINSDKALRTSIANPKVFAQGLFSAVKHDDVYKEAVREGALSTSFDIGRTPAKLALSTIRAEKSKSATAFHLITHPQDLLRTAENLIGKSEELGRMQQYIGNRNVALKAGKTPEQARILGANAARWNTANFARAGDFGRVLNMVIPYFNAGLQGGRVLAGSLRNKPMQTATKLAVAVFAPVAAVTAWNLQDPARAKIYNDIQETDKQNNIVIVPPNATKDANGQYNVIKIPLSQEVANLASVLRRTIEEGGKISPNFIKDVSLNLFGAASGLNINSGTQAVGQFTPQLIKPAVETATNTNLFTGNQVVPDKMKNFPPEAQAKPSTSGTARIIASKLNTSPLVVENAVKTSLGGLGSELLNLSDTTLAKLGKIPTSQIGGEDPGSATLKAFTKSSGGASNKPVTTQDLYNNLKNLPPNQRDKATQVLAKDNPPAFAALKEYVKVSKMTPDEQSIYQRNSTNGDRAKYVLNQAMKIQDVPARNKYINTLIDHGVLTKPNIQQIQDLVKQQKQQANIPSQTPIAETPKQYVPLIAKAASDNGVPAKILSAIAKIESGFRPDAVQPDGLGRGMFQIDLGQHPEISEAQAKDPQFAANYAARLLASRYKRYGNWDDAIRAYNGDPTIPATQRYLDKVKSAGGA